MLPASSQNSAPPQTSVKPIKKKLVWISAIAVLVISLLAGAVYASPSMRDLALQKILTVKRAIAPSPSLDVSPLKGSLPLNVKVTYPQEWQSLIDEQCRENAFVPFLGGTVFVIDWGDGRKGQPCDTHTYTAAGAFLIQAHVYSFSDTLVREWGGNSKLHWEASANVTVSGIGSPPFIELISPRSGESFSYQEFPETRWHIRTGKKLNLQIDLLDQDGKSFASETIDNVAYNGEGSIRYLSPLSYEAYDSLLQAGKNKFSVRAALLDNGIVVSERTVSDLTMSAQWVDNTYGELRVSATSGAAPLMVKLDYDIWHPSCFSYRLDWGDSSAPDTHIQPIQKSCDLDSQTKTFSHVYSKPGIYTVKIKTNNLDPFKDLDSIVMYESATVTVK